MAKFGFIIHPLDIGDISKRFAFTKRLPEGLIRRAIQLAPPIKVAETDGIVSRYGTAEGCFVAVALLPDQMMSLPLRMVEDKIIKACRVAEGAGARIIGLGAFTSVVGDKGISIAKKIKTPVTTGNTYTVATALEAVREACRIMGKDLKTRDVVIVGANGSIGRACAKILSREVKYLTLVSRNMQRLEQLAQEIMADTGLSVHISDRFEGPLKRADVVISVSNSVDAIIEPEYLKKGAIVCDVARPRDVSAAVAQSRKDVFVIEGGLVSVPGDAQLGFAGLPAGTCYACMAETMVLALEGRYESYSLGNDLSIDKVYEISELARKHGFKLAGFRGVNGAIGFDQVKSMKGAFSEKAYDACIN
jgi:fatty aldehyde-generating acyl-ACP reductase